MLGHDDLGYYSGEVPADVRTLAVLRLLAFGAPEIAKLLALLDGDDFGRPSLGYSLMPLWGMSGRSIAILNAIVEDQTLAEIVRSRAACLLAGYRDNPEWWDFWRRDIRILGL